jgi:hypothetical protein
VTNINRQNKYDLCLEDCHSAQTFSMSQKLHAAKHFFNDDLASQSRDPGKQRDLFYANRT